MTVNFPQYDLFSLIIFVPTQPERPPGRLKRITSRKGRAGSIASRPMDTNPGHSKRRKLPHYHRRARHAARVSSCRPPSQGPPVLRILDRLTRRCRMTPLSRLRSSFMAPGSITRSGILRRHSSGTHSESFAFHRATITDAFYRRAHRAGIYICSAPGSIPQAHCERSTGTGAGSHLSHASQQS